MRCEGTDCLRDAGTDRNTAGRGRIPARMPGIRVDTW